MTSEMTLEEIEIKIRELETELDVLYAERNKRLEEEVWTEEEKARLEKRLRELGYIE